MIKPSLFSFCILDFINNLRSISLFFRFRWFRCCQSICLHRCPQWLLSGS
jgi:hypothetical protein